MRVSSLSDLRTDDSIAHDHLLPAGRPGAAAALASSLFGSQEQADAAVASMNEQELDGRRIRVSSREK